MGLLLLPLLPLLLFEEAGFYPHREGNGFPMHAWRFIFVSMLFESCEPFSWYSTVSCKFIKDVPNYSMLALVREDDFEFNLATFHWWQPSTTSLMIVPILIVLISTLEIALANIPRDVLVLLDVADVHQCNNVYFPYILFLCAFFMTSFDSFSIIAFASGINVA